VSAVSAAPRPVTLLVAALGGEGGGVLTDWIVGAAMRCDLPVQSTSIPGVAQRTGATTYYVEIFPVTNDGLAGRRPVLALYPSPGGLDLMVATELVEAGRALENGFVTPDRTTLIAATHRVFATVEKMAMTDGRFDGARALRAARELARRPILFDFSRSAATRHHPLNAVLLGAVAGSGQLPVPREAFEQAIRESGIAVEANLAAFAAGWELALGGPTAETEPRLEDAPPEWASEPAAPLLAAAAREIPAECLKLVEEGIRRLAEYQDEDYARLYLDRLRGVQAADHAPWRLLGETARHLALWMSYEDVIRVAALKTAPGRLAKIRAEVRAKPDEPVRVTEFFKPGIDEASALLPPAWGRRLRAWGERHDPRGRLHLPMRVATTGLSGFLRLWLLARLRPWRRRTLRFEEEQALIERWLDAVRRAARQDPALAFEIALLPRLRKGYGDTERRGRANFLAIFERLVEPALRSGGDATALRRAREAALADPEGKALAAALAAPPQPEAAAAE
jgi:indolepyruvate ferredoxin oxidoreductase beta subunit